MRWAVLLGAAVALFGAAGAVASAESLNFVKLVVDLPMGNVWASSCEEELKWTSGAQELDPAPFVSVFNQAAKARGLAPSGSTNLFEPERPSGGYSVGAIVRQMRYANCFNPNVTMTVEWQVYSPLERRVVLTTTTNTTQKFPIFNEVSLDDGVTKGFSASADAFLDLPDTRALIASGPTATRPGPARPGLSIPAYRQRERRSIQDAARAVAIVFADQGHGSGFLISSEGHLLTNEHVVGSARFVKVRWFDGAESVGEVITADRRRDIALIKTEAGQRAPLALSPTPPGSGETVFAIGAPLDLKFQGTVTRGVVSAMREIDGLSYLQSDVTVNPGNSGGPLLDDQGRVVAITDLGYRRNEAPTGINLFIPIADALSTLNISLR